MEHRHDRFVFASRGRCGEGTWRDSAVAAEGEDCACPRQARSSPFPQKDRLVHDEIGLDERAIEPAGRGDPRDKSGGGG